MFVYLFQAAPPRISQVIHLLDAQQLHPFCFSHENFLKSGVFWFCFFLISFAFSSQGGTTAHITQVIDSSYVDLIKSFGLDTAKEVALVSLNFSLFSVVFVVFVLTVCFSTTSEFFLHFFDTLCGFCFVFFFFVYFSNTSEFFQYYNTFPGFCCFAFFRLFF